MPGHRGRQNVDGIVNSLLRLVVGVSIARAKVSGPAGFQVEV